MLRESAQAQNQPVNTLAVTQPMTDSQLRFGKQLTDFADAIVLVDFDELPVARSNLFEAAGPAAVTRAAAVCADFECTNRVVDAIGVPVNKRYYDIGDELRVSVPDHLR